MAFGCIKQNIGSSGISSSSASGSESVEHDRYTHVYAGAYLAPARNDSNVTMFTWNASLITKSFKLYRVWRVLTTTNPNDLSSSGDWDYTDNPTDIYPNLADAVTKDITSYAKEGDLYRDWIDADTYEGYYIMYDVIYETDGEGWSSVATPTYDGYEYKIRRYCIHDAPSLSFDRITGDFTIGKSMVGKRFIEFYRADKSYGYPTDISDEETLNEMLLTSIISQENEDPRKMYQGYYTVSNRVLTRWAEGTYTVGVDFKDTQNKSIIDEAINSAISKVNSVLNNFGVYFIRSGTSGDMSIIVDTEWNLYEIDLETGPYVYGGTWETEEDSSGYITSATVRLASDALDFVPFVTYEVIALEEIIQCMGAGYDQVEYPFNTIHTEFNYLNKSASLTTKDKNILKLVYSSYVNAGDTHYEVSKKLNIPKGVYRVSASPSDDVRTVSFDKFLDKGVPYYVRAFIVNSSGKLSYTSSWIRITTPSILGWSWSKSNGSATSSQTIDAYTAITNNGYVSDFSYKVWNDMVDKVKEALDACGESWSSKYASYADTKISSSNKMLTATKFNSLRFNIGSHVTTDITEKSPGDTVYGKYFTILTNKLNEWIESI